MGAKDGDGKPRQQPPAKPPAKPASPPAKPANPPAKGTTAHPARHGETTEPVRIAPGSLPARTAAPAAGRTPGPGRGSNESAFELTPVGGARSQTISDLKRVGPGASSNSLPTVGRESDFEVTGSGAARSPSVADLRRMGSSPDLPRVATRSKTDPSSKPPAAPAVAASPLLTLRPNVYQRQLQSSRFDEDERTQIDAVLGNVGRVELDVDEESTASHQVYDGETPAKEVTATEAWKAINAPVQSRPGRRSARIAWSLIDQFAVGHNARYDPDAPERTRAHIFLWDVSRAMGCEVPHFTGGRELSLSQTVDWIRLEGRNRGWNKLDASQAAEAADRGELVVAMPRDLRHKLVVVVRPGGVGDDGQVRVASGNTVRGNDLGVREALGVTAIEYFGHE